MHISFLTKAFSLLQFTFFTVSVYSWREMHAGGRNTCKSNAHTHKNIGWQGKGGVLACWWYGNEKYEIIRVYREENFHIYWHHRNIDSVLLFLRTTRRADDGDDYSDAIRGRWRGFEVMFILLEIENIIIFITSKLQRQGNLLMHEHN